MSKIIVKFALFVQILHLVSLDPADKAQFSLKFKSIKCLIDKPESVNLNFCFIKPISRTTSSLNIGFQLLEDWRGPSEVSCIHRTLLNNFISIFWKFSIAVLYKYGQIFREVLRFKMDYCQLWKHNVFKSDNPLVDHFYYALETSLPDLLKHACPFTKGTYNVPNVTVSYQFLPLDYWYQPEYIKRI